MSQEFVVLLHGILRSKTDMLALDNYLKKRDFDTANILYPSRKMTLEDLTAFVTEKIENHPDYSPEKTLHFVTHSMGGLIARYYIATHKPENLGKVVMLGPPNTGSEFADFLHDHEILGPMFRKIFGPASTQLKTDYQHIDGDIDYPLGVIAGSASINPLAPWVLDGKHDGIVPVERTKIKGMTDHIVIASTHTFMMFNPVVMSHVYSFLRDGHFLRKKEKSETELVALLHGIANPGIVMTPIALWLKEHGYETLNIEYPSQNHEIPRLSKYIHRALNKKKYSEYKNLHFVTYSLGGLVLRSYLKLHRPSNLGRVVMLAPPNQGTQAADNLMNEWFYKLFFGPAGQQLSTDTQRPYDDGNIDFELGIIAGTKCEFNAADLLSKSPLPKPNDGAVTVENTKLKGMKDHICVDVSHPLIINDLDAKKQTLNFLMNGEFTKD